MSFVLDASVAARWFFGDGAPRDLAYAARVLDALAEGPAHVPGLWGLEITNVIARAEAQKLVAESRGDAFLALLKGLDIRTDEATAAQALGDTLRLARRYRLSAYDAAYLELAQRAGLPLATLDADLRKAAAKAGVPRFAAR